MDSDQTAPIGAVCSGSTLFSSRLNSSVILRQLFAADDFSRQHFQMHFFLGALRVNFKKNLADCKKILKNYPACKELSKFADVVFCFSPDYCLTLHAA